MAVGVRGGTRPRVLAAVVLLGALTAGTRRVWGRASGPSVWAVSVGQGPTALAVNDRRARVFVVNTDDATVSVLDARSGTVLATQAVGRYPGALAVDEASGRDFFLATRPGDGPDSVSVLAARSRARRATIAVGAQRLAVAVAMDTQASRAVVVSAGGLIDQPTEWWGPWVQALLRL